MAATALGVPDNRLCGDRGNSGNLTPRNSKLESGGMERSSSECAAAQAHACVVDNVSLHGVNRDSIRCLLMCYSQHAC